VAVLPSVLIAQTLTLAGEISIQIADSFSTRTITLVSAGSTRYGRIYLAPTAAFGTTISTPYDVLSALETLINAAAANYWSVRLQTSGAVKVTYNGGSGNGTLTWTANGTGLRNLLGFTGTIGPLAVGASSTATYPPGGTILSLCADESDTSWQARPASVAAATTADGRTVVIDSGYQSLRRSMRLRLHPTTWTEATSGDYVTPAFPLDTSAQTTRWTSPTATGYLDSGAYSAHQLIATAHRDGASAQLGVTVGELQLLLAGSVTDFDQGSLTADSVRGSDERFPLSVPGWYKRRDIPLVITRSSRVAR
jgi:hypothetical protein